MQSESVTYVTKRKCLKGPTSRKRKTQKTQQAPVRVCASDCSCLVGGCEPGPVVSLRSEKALPECVRCGAAVIVSKKS